MFQTKLNNMRDNDLLFTNEKYLVVILAKGQLCYLFNYFTSCYNPTNEHVGIPNLASNRSKSEFLTLLTQFQSEAHV
jgi:hypothetical protein